MKNYKKLIEKAQACIDLKDFKTVSGEAKSTVFSEGICEKVQNSLRQIFETVPDMRQKNPFFEERKPGRPSLEKRMRRDFWMLWEIEFGTGFMASILRPGVNCRHIPIGKVGENGPVRMKFIARG